MMMNQIILIEDGKKSLSDWMRKNIEMKIHITKKNQLVRRKIDVDIIKELSKFIEETFTVCIGGSIDEYEAVGLIITS